MEYCVITLDLVNSRHLPDRKQVQEDLKAVLKQINEKYSAILTAPFGFTQGDEVQGVLCQLGESYRVIEDFQRLFQAHPFYAGVGFGEIVTQLSQRSGEMDGPAFHLARRGIEQLKEAYNRSRAQTSPRRFALLVAFAFSDRQLTEIANNYLQMVELLKFNLTEKQREVYWLMRVKDRYSEIADLLNQSKSAITQKVQAGHLEEVVAGERGLYQLLLWIETNLSEKGVNGNG